MGIKEDAEPLVGKNNDPPEDIKDEFNFLNDSEFVECYSTITNCNNSVFEFIKTHDCFLNLTEIELEKTSFKY